MYKYIKPFYIKKSVKTQIYYLLLSILYWIHLIFYVFLLKLYESRGEEMKTYIFESITIDEHKKYKIKEIFDKKNVKNEALCGFCCILKRHQSKSVQNN